MIKVKFVIVQILKFEEFNVIIKGKIKAISTSKIKKIIAIKKNRIEKGVRDDFIGLNPHSKGALFSRFNLVFRAKIEDSHITITEIIKNIKAKINKLKIT